MSNKTDTRGVYLSSYLSPEGFPVYLAITGDKRIVAWRTCWPFEGAGEVIREVEEALDEADPQRAW